MTLDRDFLHKIIISEVNQNVRFNPTKVHVYNAFESINNACFNGKLPLCNIKMISDKKYLGYFSYEELVGNRIIDPTISINASYQYTIKEFESVVAHEMIHYYLAYYGIDVKCKHGNEFHSLASQINSSMGLQISDSVDVSQMSYSKQQFQISSQLLGYMSSYANSLKQYLPQIKQESKGKNGRLATFYSDLYIFTENLVVALNKAVKKRSLNEDMWQQMIPFKPVNDYINGFRDWYNKSNRWFNSLGDGGYDGKSKYSNSNGVKSSDLIGLLYNVYPNIKKQYQKYSMGYNSQVITNEFTIIDDLKTRIDAEINNAQGQNP
jgi:hypothetical protein